MCILYGRPRQDRSHVKSDDVRFSLQVTPDVSAAVTALNNVMSLQTHEIHKPFNRKNFKYAQRQTMERERERNVLFNDALNTFYLRLYGVRHMVKDHSDSEKGNPLLPHRLLLSINSKGSFICTIPQTG